MARNTGGVSTSAIGSEVVKFSWFVWITLNDGTSLHYTDKEADYPDPSHNITGATINYTGTWSTYDINIGSLVQSQASPLDVSFIDVQNLDAVWSGYAINSKLRRSDVYIWQAWFDPTTDAFLGSMLVYRGLVDEVEVGERVKMALVPHRTPWTSMFPARRHLPTCMYKFKDASTCQYAGADATCTRTLLDCTTKGNQAHFGGFPWMPPPNFKFVWGSVAYKMPDNNEKQDEKHTDPDPLPDPPNAWRPRMPITLPPHDYHGDPMHETHDITHR